VYVTSAHPGDRGARPRPENGVLGNECPVEVDRERGDPRGEGVGKPEQIYGAVPPVAVTTYAATSAIFWSESVPLNDGIWPLPSVTRAVASR
jgi:hypothetical protein